MVIGSKIYVVTLSTYYDNDPQFRIMGVFGEVEEAHAFVMKETVDQYNETWEVEEHVIQ